MIRRIHSVALAAVLAAGMAAAVSSPAMAADHHGSKKLDAFHKVAHDPEPGVPVIGSCSLIAPATARVVQPFLPVAARVTGGCAINDQPVAGWSIGPEGNESDFIFFDGARSTSWDLWDDTPLGTRTWRDDFAYTNDGTAQYTQNNPVTTVKVGSWAGVSTSRSGSKVTINTRIVRYSTSYQQPIAWAGATGVIQFKASGTSTWKSIKNVSTTSAGTYAYSYTNSGTGDYRVLYNEAAYIWGATSPTSTR
ncbi:hypothetical protein [Luteipulveratus mongoliensis]|uniref:Uncharacterized protein n=1 Tax=Luteipulveratus mongoliensis TaxID=571913 RepID=A0A0K1JLK6_9MICO|nr:hypothetical protein [Luteipulveratus mongoliensis]AKU17596.1 hypothetical protein VV02_20000 [Luteipulveratus mongoliensis]